MRGRIRGGTVSLKGLMRIERGGRAYWYLRRKGLPLVRLPDPDAPGFLTAYEAALTGTGRPAPPGTIAGLVEAAISSAAYRGLSEGYRRTVRRELDAIRRASGDAPARGLRPYIIEADVAKARNPADRLKAWRFACEHGRAAALLQSNPSEGVKAPKRRKTSGHPTWTAEDVERFRARWPIGTTKRAAFELLYWTGARISDAVRLGPGMVGKDGVLAYRQGKTEGVAYVPWTCSLPLHAEGWEADRTMMHEALGPIRQMTFLATHGRSRSSKALGTMIREAASEAGVAKSAHGLRKARATMLAEAGATTHEIAAWTGHESLKLVEHYTRAADRRRAVMGKNEPGKVQNGFALPGPRTPSKSEIANE